MPRVTVHLESPISRTFRVAQVTGMLDLTFPDRLTHSLTAEVPGLDQPWTIGAIVGPSGSGKTTLARAAFGEAIWQPREWPAGRAIIDCLGDDSRQQTQDKGRTSTSIKGVMRVLTAVGLGSIPTWLKPYHILSTGERFRADLARALIECYRGPAHRHGDTNVPRHSPLRASVPPCEIPPLLIIDEFTSSLDRTIAKTTSAALARLLRRGENNAHSQISSSPCLPLSPSPRLSLVPRPRFIALTCHHDILPWLSPDWVLDLAEPPFRAPRSDLRARWRPYPSPALHLQIDRVPQSTWQRFAPYHYLTGGLAASATCYGAFLTGPADGNTERQTQRSSPPLRASSSALRASNSPLRAPSSALRADPIAFCAVVAALGWPKTKRITRLVVLPEFQGLGIAALLAEQVATREQARGNRVTITANHPAILSHCSHSPRWRYLGLKKNGSTRQRYAGREVKSSIGRAVASFEFVPHDTPSNP